VGFGTFLALHFNEKTTLYFFNQAMTKRDNTSPIKYINVTGIKDAAKWSTPSEAEIKRYKKRMAKIFERDQKLNETSDPFPELGKLLQPKVKPDILKMVTEMEEEMKREFGE
jgi:hypothetical protein